MKLNRKYIKVFEDFIKKEENLKPKNKKREDEPNDEIQDDEIQDDEFNDEIDVMDTGNDEDDDLLKEFKNY